MPVDLSELKRLEAAATESLGPFEDGHTRAVEVFERALRHAAPALIAELEALRRDKERLDWMEANPYTAYRQRDHETGRVPDYHVLVSEDVHPRVGILKATFREAIDAAMPQPVAAILSTAPDLAADDERLRRETGGAR
jgi:hypothetical protein